MTGFVLMACLDQEVEILTLAIDPPYQGKGYAQNLLKDSFAELKQQGLTQAVLEVAVDNGAALCLYQKMGFMEVGKRKAYYARQDGRFVDGLVMRLTL